jgi:hypothetical protein
MRCFPLVVILSEAKDLSQGPGLHKHSCVSQTSIVGFLALLGMTEKSSHSAHKF